MVSFSKLGLDFNINSTAVRLSCELCAGKTTAEAKVKAIYDYIIKNIDYDSLVINVAEGYSLREDYCVPEEFNKLWKISLDEKNNNSYICHTM